MPHLVLDPQQLVTIDWDAFEFPKVRLIIVRDSKGAHLVVSFGSHLRLMDRSIPPSDKVTIAEVRAEVTAFNVDPISGWRDLAVRANEREKAVIQAEQDVLRVRRRALALASENAGFGAMRARRRTRVEAAGV